jgi:hypothetical protein
VIVDFVVCFSMGFVLSSEIDEGEDFSFVGESKFNNK